MVQFLLKDWKLQLLRYHNFQYHDLYVACQDKCYCLTLADDTVREREISELSTLHEETDTKAFTCINYVNESDFDKTVVHTVDTDVVVLGLYYQAFIDCEIFIRLGCGSKKRLLKLKNVELSRELCVALPGPHALTRCDSTSFIHGIGKEKAYKIFEQNEIYTDAFSLLGEFEVVPPNVIDLLEQFVCHLYNFSEDKDINEVRYKRFINRTKKKINPETLPPTKGEFFVHLKRSNYTALIMKLTFQLQPVTLLPQDHG